MPLLRWAGLGGPVPAQGGAVHFRRFGSAVRAVEYRTYWPFKKRRK
ncbi:hypothetical protein EES43_13825 [Streptomyces sp. ADI96-02]|nr:hypothetical protein EES43_13825 [Streptomyces sp. ADI96-02]